MNENIPEMKEFRDELFAHLVEQEGWKNFYYRDSRSIPTIGCGRNISEHGGKGLTDQEISYLLENDITEVIVDLESIFPDFYVYSPDRRIALCSMRFQLGAKGFRGFTKTIELVKARNWKEAANQVLLSRAAQQTPRRYTKISQLLGDPS